MKVSTFDAEATNLAGDLGIMLCLVAKEFEGPMKVYRIDQYPGYRKAIWDDKRLVKDVRDDLETRGIIVGWNSGGGPYAFDLPFIQTRLAIHNMRPLKMPKHIDLMKTAKFQMRFRGNSLAVVSESLTVDRKTKLDGKIWLKAAAGVKSALDEVVYHCKQDVLVLEQVLAKLGPHVSSIKNWI